MINLHIFTDLLLDSLELCKYTLAAKEIYRQCQIENYGFTAKVFFMVTLMYFLDICNVLID